MDIYFYCSYENSKRGFYLTRLEGDKLVPENLSGRKDRCGQLVDRFFTYDDFRILWREIPENNAIPLFPTAERGMFGIRGLQGMMSGRRATGNIALIAGANELKLLRNIAVGIISDTDSFAASLFNCLSVGGPCGYSADAKAIRTLTDTLGKTKPEERNLPNRIKELIRQSEDGRPMSERDLLRFAVYVATWEQAAEHMTPQWLWKKRPVRALSIQEFEKLRNIEA